MSFAVGLLAEGQHFALSTLCGVLGADYQGLSVAARAACRAQVISKPTSKRLQRLDEAAHWARHVSRQRIDRLGDELSEEIAAAKRAKQEAVTKKAEEVGDDEVARPECLPTSPTRGVEARAEVADASDIAAAARPGLPV